jgi:hypothetical protein
VAARIAYQKARMELDRATDKTLLVNAISIDSARAGIDLAARVKR